MKLRTKLYLGFGILTILSVFVGCNIFNNC